MNTAQFRIIYCNLLHVIERPYQQAFLSRPHSNIYYYTYDIHEETGSLARKWTNQKHKLHANKNTNAQTRSNACWGTRNTCSHKHLFTWRKSIICRRIDETLAHQAKHILPTHYKTCSYADEVITKASQLDSEMQSSWIMMNTTCKRTNYALSSACI